MLFQEIKEASAVTRMNGVYREHRVFHFQGRVYIKHGEGYAYIYKDKSTSKDKMRVVEILLPFQEKYDSLGALAVCNHYTQKEKQNENN